MRPILIALVLAGLLAAGVLWLSAGDAGRGVTAWALDRQQALQGGLARALRALRTGETGAMAAFLTLCFSYGFFHAVGPGHGKLVIGGYGLASPVRARWLSLVALISSLGQSLTAIVLVGVGLWLLDLGRARMTALADEVFAPLSFALIAGLGVWLIWRGGRGLWRRRALPETAPGTCSHCGHAHAPDPQALAQAGTWREAAALILSVAIRPCTGALFVLILTAQMGIFAAGVAGVVAMGLGTAGLTLAAALASVTLRHGMAAAIPGAGAVALLYPALEIALGLVIAVMAGGLALAAL